MMWKRQFECHASGEAAQAPRLRSIETNLASRALSREVAAERWSCEVACGVSKMSRSPRTGEDGRRTSAGRMPSPLHRRLPTTIAGLPAALRRPHAEGPRTCLPSGRIEERGGPAWSGSSPRRPGKRREPSRRSRFVFLEASQAGRRAGRANEASLRGVQAPDPLRCQNSGYILRSGPLRPEKRRRQ